MTTPIYSGPAQLVSGGWERPNPYCEDCDDDRHQDFETQHAYDGATYVTLRIPDNQIGICLGDRYELTITAPEDDQ